MTPKTNRAATKIQGSRIIVSSVWYQRPNQIEQRLVVLRSAEAPFRLMNKVGLDAVLDIEERYAAAQGHSSEWSRASVAPQMHPRGTAWPKGKAGLLRRLFLAAQANTVVYSREDDRPRQMSQGSDFQSCMKQPTGTSPKVRSQPGMRSKCISASRGAKWSG
jgi:hypothetical protein